MTQYKDVVETQLKKLKEEKDLNTSVSIGWQREELGS